jgi:hypothetical protein
MKIGNKDLKKAYSMVRDKKYTKAIRFLEPKVPLFLEDELFYYLLGISCYHTGDIGGSEFYFKRSLQVNHDNVESRLYLATIQLKRKDQANAARLWLNILDSDPGNKFAQRGLNKLKKIKDPSSFEEFINSNELNKLHSHIKGIPLLLKKSMASLFIVIILGFSVYFILPIVTPDKNEREKMANLSLDNYVGSFVEFEGNFLYTLTGDEIKKLFESAVDDFHNFNDNSLQKKINKLNLSNASNDIKGKISILENLIQNPTFLTLKQNFSYREVQSEPLLYDNCFVLWRGKVTNVSIGSDKITLDFLVGYENEKILEGFIFTEIPFEVSINEAVPVEILGQIKYRNDKMILSTISIRSLISENK